MTSTLHRRARNIALGWEGRLDSPSGDRIVPWVCAGGLFITLIVLALAQARALSSNVNLATFVQAVWQIRHGMQPLSTITTGENILGSQGAVVLYPLALATKLVPTIPLLIGVQSAALALAVVPLWRVCRHLANLPTGASLMVLFVYSLHPIIHTLNLDGFHPETIALPFLIGAGYFGLTQHWRRFAFCCVIAMACRADLGLAVAGIGVLLIVQGFRRRGLVALTAGVMWFCCFLVLVQPHFAHSVSQLGAYSAYGTSPLSVAWGMVTRPAEVLSQILSRENFGLLVFLFAPLLFLPFLSPRYLMPVVPLQLLYLAGEVPPSVRYGPQAVAITAFMFLALPRGLSRLGRVNVTVAHIDRRVLITMAIAACSFFVLFSPSSPYEKPWFWGGQDAADGARIEVANAIPADTRVRSTASVLTLLSERSVLYSIDSAPIADGEIHAEAIGADVDVIVIDRRDLLGSDQRPVLLKMEISRTERQLESDLQAQGFAITFDSQEIVKFERHGDEP
ncbi:MAG: DUF2079 domain-containing protein [Actinomycetes bacterium]